MNIIDLIAMYEVPVRQSSKLHLVVICSRDAIASGRATDPILLVPASSHSSPSPISGWPSIDA